MDTKLAIALVNSRSYPVFVPSLSIDVRRISPAPFFSAILAYSTGIDAIEYAKIAEKNGAGEILLTSMDKDGTKTGYDLELTKAISSLVSIPVIASGGVGNLDHLYEGFNIGLASAVLAASIFHYGEYSIMDAKNYLIKKGIPIRI